MHVSKVITFYKDECHGPRFDRNNLMQIHCRNVISPSQKTTKKLARLPVGCDGSKSVVFQRLQRQVDLAGIILVLVGVSYQLGSGGLRGLWKGQIIFMRQQRSSSNKGQRSIVLTTDALHLIFGITMYIENKKDYDMRCFLRGGNGFFDVNNAFGVKK